MASSSMTARSAAEAPCRPRLNGCSRAGRKRSSSRPSVSCATRATIRWPWWTGSNEPPSRPMDGMGSGAVSSRVQRGMRAASRRLRPLRACLPHPGRRRMEAPNVATGLLHVFLVAEGPVGLHQMDEGVRGDGAPRIGRDQVLEVQNGGVVSLEPHVEQGRLVLLVGEALLQVVDSRLGSLGRLGAGIAVDQLLIGGERGLAVRRVQLRTAPQVGVRVAYPEQRLGRERIVGRVVRRLPELARGVEVVAHREMGLAEPEVRLRNPLVTGRELEQRALEMLDGLAPFAAPHLVDRLIPELVDVLSGRGLRNPRDRRGGGLGCGGRASARREPGEQQVAMSSNHRSPVRAVSASGSCVPSASSWLAATTPVESLRSPDTTVWNASAAARVSPFANRVLPYRSIDRLPVGVVESIRADSAIQSAASWLRPAVSARSPSA